MAQKILPNQAIRADHFINESEKNATPANDEGRVPKLESDAKIHRDFLPQSDVFEGVAGQDISAKMAVFKSTGTEMKCLGGRFSGGNDQTLNGYQNTYRGTIVTIPYDCIIKAFHGISAYTRYGTCTLEIRNVVGGNSIGNTVLYTANLVTTANSQISDQFFEISGLNISANKGQQYAIVQKWVGTAGGSVFKFKRCSAVLDDSSQISFASSDGSTWSSTGTDIYQVSILTALNASKIYRSDVFMFNSKVEGVAQNTIGVGGAVVVTRRGSFTTSGLTAGSKYYIGDGSGVINTTSVDNEFVGLATTTTNLEVGLGYDNNVIQNINENNISANGIVNFKTGDTGSSGYGFGKLYKYLSPYTQNAEHEYADMFLQDLYTDPFVISGFLESTGRGNSRALGSIAVPIGTKIILKSNGSNSKYKTAYKG